MKILINSNLIAYETFKSTLIKVPGTHYRFWIASKMIWPKGGMFELLLPEKWSYKLYLGKSKIYKEVVDIEFMREHFSKFKKPFEVLEENIPKKLTGDVEIDDSLFR